MMNPKESESSPQFCPVCQSAAKVDTSDYGERRKVECPACGMFIITKTAINVAANNDFVGSMWRSIISYWIRQKQPQTDGDELTRDVVLRLLKSVKLPNPRVQQENLIRWVGQNVRSPEEFLIVEVPVVAARIGANYKKGLKYIITNLVNEGFLEFAGSVEKHTRNKITDTDRIRLTFKGWDKYNSIKNVSQNSNFSFMAMQFNDKEHDYIYHKHFKPAVEATGFNLKRMDECLAAGLIDNQIRVEIRNARFLLADLTNDNLGAYWEAGFAEGLGIPVIYLCKKEHFEQFKTHFDTNHHTTIIWDPGDMNNATKNLKSTIRATLPIEAKMVDDQKTIE